MQFSLATGERPQQPRFILFVGEGLKQADLFSTYEFRQYQPEVKWDRTRHNPDDTFDSTKMRSELRMWSELATKVPHHRYLICPEVLYGSKAEGILAVMKEFKAVLNDTQKPNAPLSVVTLNTHVAKGLLKVLMGMGFGPQILVMRFPKEGNMSMGWAEQDQFVSNKPFHLESGAVSMEQLIQHFWMN